MLNKIEKIILFKPTGELRKRWKASSRVMSKKFLKDKCELCSSTEELTIHHQIPLKEIQSNPDFFSKIMITKENCRTLCNKCHTKIHHIHLVSQLVFEDDDTLLNQKN